MIEQQLNTYRTINKYIDDKNFKNTEINNVVIINLLVGKHPKNHDRFKIYLAIKKLEQEHILNFISRNKSPDCFVIKVNTKLFKSFYSSFQENYRKAISSEIQESKRKYYKDILIDLNKGTLDYKGNEINISPDNNPIKFLTLLIEKAEFIVEYLEIAKRLELNSYQEEDKNKDVAREIQYLKRDLGKELKKSGLNKSAINEIKEMIIFNKNLGYKLKKN